MFVLNYYKVEAIFHQPSTLGLQQRGSSSLIDQIGIKVCIINKFTPSPLVSQKNYPLMDGVADADRFGNDLHIVSGGVTLRLGTRLAIAKFL